jgi:pimeloyl-ACP methyl ester carboxylesterase
MRAHKSQNFQIAYECWGDPAHHPVLFFHGFPGSYIQATALVPFLRERKIFLISADRPGYGQTVGSGSLLAYLDALDELLCVLGIREFSVIGVSGGSPWAHLMASRFAGRVRSLLIICGLGPYNATTKIFFSKVQRTGLMLNRLLPERAAEAVVAGVLNTVDPERKLVFLERMLDWPDREALRDSEIRGILLQSMVQAQAQGSKGVIFDAGLYSGDWMEAHCDLEKLRSIPTFYFHGGRDRILDFRMSHWMHKRHGNSRLGFFEQEGHYSLPFRQAGKILRSL